MNFRRLGQFLQPTQRRTFRRVRTSLVMRRHHRHEYAGRMRWPLEVPVFAVRGDRDALEIADAEGEHTTLCLGFLLLWLRVG